MTQENVPLIAFNRGYISRLGLARVDLKRTALSAELQRNWMPRVLGSMMLRPGFGFIGESNDSQTAFHIPFIFSTTDTAILEITDEAMRVYVDDALISRVAVSTSVTNGDFSSGTGWTDADEAGGVSTITGGKLELVGTSFNQAIRKREVTVSGGDVNKEHALRIIVERGPITFRCGSTDGGDEYISETTLGTGYHSLAFTPTGNFWVQLAATAQAKKVVDSIQVEAAGALEIPAPWVEDDLGLIRYDQSADVVFVACTGYEQRRIERRGTGRSWSIILYEPSDGPFRNSNVGPITLTPTALTGDITLTASKKYFKSTNVGSLFKITSIGQQVAVTLTGDNQWSAPIRVTGIGGVSDERRFTRAWLGSAGTLLANITVQRSIGEPGAWVDYSINAVGGGDASTTQQDDLDNQIVYYRIGINTGDYTSGTGSASLTYANGSLSGIVRITAYTSETSVSAAVLSPLGGTDGSSDWAEGEWSLRRGYPSSVTFHQGRLFWAGKSKIWGSVSDAYDSFDEDVEGDSGPINRSIASGPVDSINWLVRLKRLVLGTDGAEYTAQSSSLDEPLTPSNFTLDDPSTQGSARVGGIKLDDRCLFAHRCTTKLFQVNNQDDVYANYKSVDLSELVPELKASGIVRIAAQRQLDTRIHCVLGNGLVAILISQPAEEVLCWVDVETDGFIEDVVILPGVGEDQVYYLVRRTIDGDTVRYLEKWAMETECQGGLLNKQADSFIIYDDVATDTITGLDHLEGEEVVIWADGRDMAGPDRANPVTYTVTGGSVTLAVEVSQACIGLYYEARFKSSKLAFAAQMGTALTMKKKICAVGLILANTHYQGLRYGPSFDTDVDGNYTLMDDLPLIENGEETDEDTVWEAYDSDRIAFNGEWNTDSRICLLAQAPRPCTTLAAIVDLETHG